MGFFSSLFGDNNEKTTNTNSSQSAQSSTGLTGTVLDYAKNIGGIYNPANYAATAQQVGQANPYQTQAAANQASVPSLFNPAINNALTVGGYGIDPSRIALFQSPYQQQVIDTTLRNMDYANAQANAHVNANAAKLGALSGTQPLVARSIAERNQGDQRNAMVANLLNTGFNTAAGLAGQSAGLQLQGSGLAGTLLGQMTGANQGLFGMGSGLQQIGTQGALTPYQLATQGAQTYGAALAPYSGQQSSGTSSGTQVSNDTATPSLFSTIAGGIGLAAKLAPMFSDERIKDNIRKIGSTHSGQPIYKFNYMGDPQTRIGLMAQDVERRHPDAVTSVGGIKAVDYDAATKADERRGMSAGGSLSLRPFHETHDPHHKLMSAFGAIKSMLHKASGGSVGHYEAGGSVERGYGAGDVGLGSWDATVTPVGGVNWGKVGDAFSGAATAMSPQRSGRPAQGDLSPLHQSQSGLSQLMSTMGVRPGYADAGSVWDADNRVAPALDWPAGNLTEADAVAGPQAGFAPYAGPNSPSAEFDDGRASSPGWSLPKFSMPQFSMPKLSVPNEGIMAGKEPTASDRLATALMSVSSPRFNAPFAGVAKNIMDWNQHRMEQQRIDQARDALLGRMVDPRTGTIVPTMAAQHLALESAKNPAQIAALQAQSEAARMRMAEKQKQIDKDLSNVQALQKTEQNISDMEMMKIISPQEAATRRESARQLYEQGRVNVQGVSHPPVPKSPTPPSGATYSWQPGVGLRPQQGGQ